MSGTSGDKIRILSALIAFTILIGGYFVLRYLKTENSITDNKKTTTNQMDSASITEWDIIPKGDKTKAYSIIKDSGLYWKIKMPDSKIADADLKTVGRSLKHLSNFKQMVEVDLDKSKWKNEGIDENGTRLIVYVNNEKADSFIIGKLEFTAQSKSSYNIRRPGSDKTYLVNGLYIEGSVIAPSENFRKREMVPVASNHFKTLKIVTPGNNQYYLIEKIHDTWSMNGQKAIQQKVLSYVKMLSLIQIPAFAEKTSSAGAAMATLDIDTDYGPVKLTATQDKNGNWILGSSVNIGNYLRLNTAQVNAVFLLQISLCLYK